MNDNMIIKMFFDRDEIALVETERKYEKYLFKIAYNILFDTEDCKECVNDTYMRAWNTIPPNSPKKSFGVSRKNSSSSCNRYIS